MMPLAGEHRHGMMKDVATTLDALVQPTSSMLFFVNRDGECLSTTIIHGIDDGDIEFVWMLGEMLGAGHS